VAPVPINKAKPTLNEEAALKKWKEGDSEMVHIIGATSAVEM
jgi:hypothetical protein